MKKNQVYIANVETGEVFQIEEHKAFELFSKKPREWFITDKKIYNQYIEYRLNKNNTPAPNFKIEIDDKIAIINVVIPPIYNKKENKRKSNSTKRNNARIQLVYEKKQKVFIETWITTKGKRLLKQSDLSAKEIDMLLQTYGKNRYITSSRNKVLKTIIHTV